MRTLALPISLAFLFANAATAQETVSEFNFSEKSKEQWDGVAQDRTVYRGIADMRDIVGTVTPCSEEKKGSGIYVPGRHRYPVDQNPQVEIKDPDEKLRLLRVIVAKGGSISGLGAEVGASKKRHVELATYEVARHTTKARMDDEFIKSASASLMYNGAKEGDQGCYIWSVSEVIQKAFVDEEKNFNLATPGIFIVSGKAFFQRNSTAASLDRAAFISIQPFKVVQVKKTLHNDPGQENISRETNQQPVNVQLDMSQFTPQSPEEIANAKRIVALANRQAEFLATAEGSGIILSQGALEKLNRYVNGEVRQVGDQ